MKEGVVEHETVCAVAQCPDVNNNGLAVKLQSERIEMEYSKGYSLFS